MEPAEVVESRRLRTQDLTAAFLAGALAATALIWVLERYVPRPATAAPANPLVCDQRYLPRGGALYHCQPREVKPSD